LKIKPQITTAKNKKQLTRSASGYAGKNGCDWDLNLCSRQPMSQGHSNEGASTVRAHCFGGASAHFTVI